MPIESLNSVGFFIWGVNYLIFCGLPVKRAFFTGSDSMTQAQKERIAGLQRSGLGYRKIAAELGMSVDTVKSYCRRHAMLHSLSSQVSYYSKLIQEHPGWAYCGVYTDEAVTGTKDHRNGFQALLSDCRDGKIEIKTAELIQFDFSGAAKF